MQKTKLKEIKKPRERRTDPRTNAVNLIFKDSPDLLVKLKNESKKSFRTPSQQLVYYAWKCIDFME